MIARLVMAHSAAPWTGVPLAEGARLGSAADNDLCIGSSGVARYHARIVTTDGDYWVEAASDQAPVFVNGESTSRMRLHHLDVLTLGAGADLVFLEDRSARAPEPLAAIEAARFEWLDGPECGKTVEIARGEIVFGRAPSNAVVMDTPAVSRAHARICHTGDALTIEDLSSVNGTMVGGRRVTGVVVLQSGDRVTFGGTRSLRIEVRRRAAAAAPAPVAEARVDPAAAPAAAEPKPAVDLEWRTKLVWSAEDAPDPLAGVVPPVVPALGEPAPAAATSLGLRDLPAQPPAFAVPNSVIMTRKPAAPEAGATRLGLGDLPAQAPVLAAPPKPVEPAATRFEAHAPPVAPVVNVSDADAAVAPPSPAPRPAARPAEFQSLVHPGDAETREQVIPGGRVLEAKLTGPGGPFTLRFGLTRVGRAPDADLRIDSRTVSRAHAEFVYTPGAVTLEDRGSENGTMVNGKRTVGVTALSSGDKIAFAEFEFTIEIMRVEPAR